MTDDLDTLQLVAVIQLDILVTEILGALRTADDEEQIMALATLLVGTKRALAELR